jgi:hypothetical protein
MHENFNFDKFMCKVQELCPNGFFFKDELPHLIGLDKFINFGLGRRTGSSTQILPAYNEILSILVDTGVLVQFVIPCSNSKCQHKTVTFNYANVRVYAYKDFSDKDVQNGWKSWIERTSSSS